MGKIKKTRVRIKESNTLFLGICDKNIKLICGSSLKKQDITLLKKAFNRRYSHYGIRLEKEQALPKFYHHMILKRTPNKTPIIFAFEQKNKTLYVARKDLAQPETLHALKEFCAKP